MKKTNLSLIAYGVCLLTSIALAVGGFLMPPKGVIDGSVITTIGELLGFATLALTPLFIKSARSTKFTTRGGTTIEVKGKEVEHAQD